MNGFQFLYGLQFNDYKVLYKQVNAITAIYINLTILYRKKFLSLDFEALFEQFVLKARLVCRLKQTRTEFAMNVNGCPDYYLCDLIRFHYKLCVLCGLCGESYSFQGLIDICYYIRDIFDADGQPHQIRWKPSRDLLLS